MTMTLSRLATRSVTDLEHELAVAQQKIVDLEEQIRVRELILNPLTRPIYSKANDLAKKVLEEDFRQNQTSTSLYLLQGLMPELLLIPQEERTRVWNTTFKRTV